MSAATPPTGGDTISAKALGLNSIEAVICLGDAGGLYSGVCFPQAVTTSGPLIGSGADSSVVLKWLTLTAGGLVETAGSTNLSAVSMRVLAIGN